MSIFKKDNQKKTMNSYEGEAAKRRLKQGGFSAILIIIAIAVVVAANIAVVAIPTNITKIDTSNQELYTLSEQTKTIVSSLKQDIDIYLIAQSGNENNALMEVLKRYEALSEHVLVHKKDPAVSPTFASQYTDQSLSENSLIVVSGERSKAIDNSSIFVEDSSNYYTTGQTSYSFDGESQITSAIDFVTSENLPKAYFLQGHGETAFPEAMATKVSDENIETQEISLLTEGSIPEDCDVLFIVAPTSDLSEEEATAIKDYMKNGGRLMLFTTYSKTEQPNLLSIAEEYGMSLINGVVMDADANHFYNNYSYVLPDRGSHEITAPITEAGLYNMVLFSQGIEIEDTYRSTLTIDKLLTTSDSSYAKMNVEEIDSLEKAEGDIEGPFTLAAAAEETYGDVTTKMVWFASPYLLDSSVDTMVNGANGDLILNSIAWMTERENNITIHAKDLMGETLSLTTLDGTIWFVVFTIILPLAIIIFGLVFWLVRRKR